MEQKDDRKPPDFIDQTPEVAIERAKDLFRRVLLQGTPKKPQTAQRARVKRKRKT